jgi:hypothetical protein
MHDNPVQKESTMSAAPRHSRRAQEGSRPQASATLTPQKKVGRPRGKPSTIVNLRIPIDLLAELDRYIDRLEGQTGLKANRGMIVRRAVALFLETRASGPIAPSL